MITSTMLALTFDGPATDISRTGVAAVATPTPGPGEVLIRVTHAGINFKDVMMRRDDPGYVPVWPVIPGLEVAGAIEQRGDGVDNLEIGMRVAALTNTGGLAEYVVARESLTTRIPDGVPSEVAAVVPGVWATAWLLLHEAARVRDGDTILVHSASGAVGTAIAGFVPPKVVAPLLTPGVTEFGRTLFTERALPFEIASVLLLIALVGAVWWAGGEE